MGELFVLLAHLCKTLVKRCRPGGIYAVAAESLAVKHQLQVMSLDDPRERLRAGESSSLSLTPSLID